ncbi:MAG TPA: HAD-IIIA family hydrolase [Chloroflexota bacterium]|nr:HAD-IIIA family hydrolase [Chloroflexota bacterium]
MFLDRDGVLVATDVRDGAAYAVTTLADFRVLPDVAAQVARLRAAGLVCIVFTNQPEVARGTIAPEVIAAMHDHLRAAVPVDDVYVCPHDDADQCACRKPRPGMLEQAAARWGVRLADSFVIGDRWRDIGAGRAAGCYTVLLEREYSGAAAADARVATLAEAVDAVLARLKILGGASRASGPRGRRRG